VTSVPKLSALVSILAGAALLAGCGTARDPRRTEIRPEPQRPSDATPRTCNPRRLIGLLIVSRHTVFVNTQRALTGHLVCDGDMVTTDSSGSADVVPDQDKESDSIHIAEGTDPRFSWLQRSGCLQIDRYVQGKIIVTTRRLCMVVRTADTLILQSSAARTQFTVAPARTDVAPVTGVAIKLKPETQTQVLSRALLETQRADPKEQPVTRQLNVYSTHKVLQRSRLLQKDIDAIERSRIRTPIQQSPAPAPR
jgi:hypothetical protein